MNCINCGAYMVGDGYKQVLHCPDAVEEDFIGREPDANAVYCRHVTDEVARELSLPVTSIPKLIKQYGSGVNAACALGISEQTVAKYRLDRDCDKHLIINGRLFTVRSGNEKGKTK